MEQTIRALHDGGVLTLTFDRPSRKNALTAAMYATLAEHLVDAASDPATRVAVIQGAEDVFTAGNDVEEFLQSPPTDSEAPVFRFLRALASFPKPLVAAVCGPAVGIGTTLLLHCDFVYCGDNALFSLPFVNLGLCPEAGASVLLASRIGATAATEKLMLGEPFAADEAVALGLVNRVLPAPEVASFAQGQAARLAARPAAALAATKELLRGPQRAAVLEAIEREGRMFGELLRGPAAKEAFAAFLGKRRPDFSGM